MPCIGISLPLPPPLPTGVSLPVFTTPPFTIGFCCSIHLPSYATPAIVIPIPYLAAVNTALTAYIKGAQAFLDGIIPPCPTQ